jgi:cell division transport system permease protein
MKNGSSFPGPGLSNAILPSYQAELIMGFTKFNILFRHTIRNIQHGGFPFVFAMIMTGLGLFGMTVFLTVFLNLTELSIEIGQSVGAVVFLEVDGAPQARDVQAMVSALPGVQHVSVITPAKATAQVRKSLGDTGALLEGTAGLELPWVLEVTPTAFEDIPLPALLVSIQSVEGVHEVLHPGGDMKRIQAMLRLFQAGGLFLTVLVALVTILVVSNTIKLTLFSRREEIAILKLVGATNLFVRIPFLMEGLVQGLCGALLALAGAFFSHATLAQVVQLALSGTLDSFTLHRLPVSYSVGMVIAGAILGSIGASVSLGKFLRV